MVKLGDCTMATLSRFHGHTLRLLAAVAGLVVTVHAEAGWFSDRAKDLENGAKRIAPPSVAGHFLTPALPAGARLLPGAKEKESHLQRRNGMQEADVAGRRGADRQVKATGQAAKAFESRMMREGKPLDAIGGLKTDPLRSTRSNVAKTMRESKVIADVARNGADVVAPVVGRAALDGNMAYEASGGNVGKAIESASISAGTSLASSAVDSHTTSNTVGDVIARSAGKATISALATDASGGDHKDIAKAAKDAALHAAASSAVHSVAESPVRSDQELPQDRPGIGPLAMNGALEDKTYSDGLSHSLSETSAGMSPEVAESTLDGMTAAGKAGAKAAIKRASPTARIILEAVTPSVADAPTLLQPSNSPSSKDNDKR